MTIKNAAIIAAAFAWVSTPSVIFGQTTAKSADSTMMAMKASTLSLVREGERSMSQGSKNALTIDLPKTTPKEAEKLWKDYAKQFKGDTKKDKKTDEWFTDNAMIAAIGGANTIDMYTKFEETGGNTTMGMWIDLGGAYVGSKEFSDKYKEAENIMKNFALTVAREQTKKQLSDQSDELKTMERKQRNLEKDNIGLHEDIDKYKQKIAKAESDIQVNLKNQEESKKKIESQRKLVDEIQKKLNNLN